MIRKQRRPTWVAAALLAAVGVIAVADEPAGSALPRPRGFRGDGTGRYPAARPPLEWSTTNNVRWSTNIGPNKYSSPIVVNGRVFLVAEPALLICVDAADGRILWQRSNGVADLGADIQGKPPPLRDAGNTTPTPVSDGRFVYAVFGSGIVAGYDLQGERRWIRCEGPFPAPEYGRSASPLLAGDKLLVSLSCLRALDVKTGATLWKNKDVPEQYGSPAITTVGGVEIAVLPSGQIVRVSDGAILASDLGGLRYASPIVQDDTVFLIQAGSSAQRLITGADKWEAKQVWEQELDGIFYASPVCDNGLIYAASNDGTFSILDAKDGKILAQKDLQFPTAGANLYPSLVLAGEYLYVFNDHGDAVVLRPGRDYKELRRNHLPEGHGGAPAFDGSRIYLRAGAFLYCIEEAASGSHRK